jgi:hypothetical protein
MSILKEERIEMLDDTINKIKEVSMVYTKASPGWTLIQAAWEHINALRHLESEINFDEQTLGVRFDE